MSNRDNRHPGSGTMGNNSQQNQKVRDAARSVGISERELSAEIHDSKDAWDSGDYSYAELIEMAKRIKNKK